MQYERSFGLRSYGLGNSTNFNYEGSHRAFSDGICIGLIPMGDRERVKPEYGVDVVEDRDSDPNIRRI